MKKKYLKDPDLAHRFDFDLRKCIHVRLFKQTKIELDIMKKRLDLSAQDIFECLSQAIINKDPYIIAMLNEYRMMKDKAETESFFSDTDTDTLFKVMEDQNPFQEEEEENNPNDFIS